MGKHFPMYATLKTAAALFDMTPKEFSGLVSDGVLPKSRKIGGYERWETDELKSIVRGEAPDGFEDIKW